MSYLSLFFMLFRETEPISNLLSATEIFEHDLAIIPYSQIAQEILDSVM